MAWCIVVWGIMPNCLSWKWVLWHEVMAVLGIGVMAWRTMAGLTWHWVLCHFVYYALVYCHIW